MSVERLALPILRVELWHGTLLMFLLVLLVPLRILEAWGLLLGGMFMGVNFLLLSCGIGWVLTPFGSKGRIRAGIFLLVLKMVLLLGLVSVLFFSVRFDPISFAVGISSLLAAVTLQALWSWRSYQPLGE